MRDIGIVCNTGKPETVEKCRLLLAALLAQGHRVHLAPETAEAVVRRDLTSPGYPLEWERMQIAVCLGGDGTLLRAAKALAPCRVPVLGINTGHLGFLTEVEWAHPVPALGDFLDQECLVEERMMLQVRVVRNGKCVFTGDALNEAVIARGMLARMVHFTAEAAGTPVADYAADGVIISTPTGSTAYALSAGGPILHPQMQALLLTPICPHTFNARSLVLPGDEAITIRLGNPDEVYLTVDGHLGHRFAVGDELRVERAPAVVRLVRRSPFRFYDVLRRKLAEPARKIGTSFES